MTIPNFLSLDISHISNMQRSDTAFLRCFKIMVRNIRSNDLSLNILMVTKKSMGEKSLCKNSKHTSSYDLKSFNIADLQCLPL